MRARFRSSRSSFVAGLTAAALVGSLIAAVVDSSPAAAGSNASLQLTKTVTGASVTPTMTATLAVDKSTAIPGDQLTYTARVTNTGAVLTLTGSYSAVEVPGNSGTLADWYDEIEYHDLGSNSWVSLGGYQATQSGWTPVVPSPTTTGLTVTATPNPASGVTYPSGGDHVLGTALGAGATASWAYTAQLTLSAAQVAALANSGHSGGIRNVVHVEVTPRAVQNGQPYVYRADFTDPIPGGGNPITGVSVAFTLPDGSTRTVDQSSVPGLASIPVGGSVDVPTRYTVPVLALPGVNEADAAYLSRLAAVGGSQLTGKATATGVGAGNAIIAATSPVSSTEQLPIVSVGKSGPATIDAGTTGSYQLPLHNTGGATAAGLSLIDTVPDGGSGTVSGTPSSLAAGGSANPTAAFPVPDSQPDGPLTDTAQVRWTDANGNHYGPVSASFTTTVQSSLAGSTLTLAPATAGPDVVGTEQVLTATLLDRNGQPVPNIAVTFTVTGTNSATGTASTSSAGVATFHYTGTAAGQDTAQAKATAGATQIASNTALIGWVSPGVSIDTTSVDGRFFTEPTSATTFVAKPSDTPTFGQSFPNIAFGPSSTALPHNLTGVGPSTHPFTDVTSDLMGNGVGAIVAQGNGQQAGSGSMTSFDAVFTADFVVSKPGDVTFRFDYDAGFLFGVGGGASRVSGAYENAPASNTSPFESYPLVGADNRPSNAVQTATVTVHFPAAGSYPYEVDYTESGGPTLSLVMSTVSFTADDTSGLSIYVGYADGLRGGGSVFPFPWSGSPGVTFVGGTCCGYDAGALRLDNTTDSPIDLDSVTVDIGSVHTDIWGRRTVPAHGTLILTQTFDYNFDSSDFLSNCGPNNGLIPKINVTIAGVKTTYSDTDQILNTKGIDQVCFGNESHPWQRIGGASTGINHPLPPAGSVVLSPVSGGDAKITSVQASVGTEQSFRVDVLDATGLPVGNAPVNLTISGTHPQHVVGTTGADGTTVLSYNAASAGDDSLQVATFLSGMQALSGTVSVHWSLPSGTTPDPNNPGQNLAATPPVIAILSPADGSRVTAPTPVQATITPPDGETITSWQVSYQAVSAGSPKVTLANGSGAPPATLGTFDPTLLPNDSYTLTVSATSSNGGLQSATSTVNVDGQLKLGRYVTTYTDVNQSVDGLPMQVLRSYDSTDPRLGDFGVGWQVSVGNFRISANRTLGAGGWTEYPAQCSLFGCQYAFKSSVPHTVTLTFPDQHQEKFDFTPSGGFSAFYFEGSAAFTAVPGTGTTSTLEAVDTDIAYDFAGNVRSGLSGPLYSPTRFKLTTKDGKVYLLDTGSGLVSETDLNGNSITVDGSGVHGSNGQSITFTKDVTGRITKITEPGGQEIDYGYSAAGDLTSVQFPDGVTEGHSYDADHHLTGSTGGEGKSASTTEYDDAGRMIAITDGAGNRTVLDNDVAGRQQIVHDPNGKLTNVLTYDDLGNLLKKEEIFGGRTVTTAFSYDSLGRVTGTQDSLGNHQNWAYDETEGVHNGNMLSHTDGSGKTVRFSDYNAHGQAATAVDNAGHLIASFTYDPNSGLLLQSQSPGLPPTTHTYDANGRLKTTVDPAGRMTTSTYDSSGHLLSETDSAGHTMTYLPDPAGRLLRTTDESGNATNYTYDGTGKLTGVHRPDGSVLTYGYDEHGLLDAVTDGGGTTRYVYDERGLVSQRTDRNGAVTTYTYDADAKLATEVRPGNDVTTYQYDALERLAEADNAYAEVTFSYDDAGNVASQVSCAPQPQHAGCTASDATSALPTTEFDYGWDSAGRQLSVTGPAGETQYDYDTVGRPDQLIDPSGQQVKQHYDDADRLSSIDLPNGIAEAFSYDSSSALTGLHATLGSSTVARSDYTLDAATGQRTSSTDLDGTTDYTYQDNGWLSSATHPDTSGLGVETFSYDGAGKRTAWSGTPAATVSYNTTGQLTTAGSLAFSYDNEGDLTTKTDTTTGASTAYHWNTDHQLTSIDLPDGTTSRYRYDPLGRRVEVASGSHIARYAYDSFNVAATYDSSNTLITSYVTMPTNASTNDAAAPAAVIELRHGDTTSYYLHDGSDSTTALTDQAGTVTARYRYSAFGTPAAGNGTDTTYTYTGAQYDPASGLYHLGARFYDPTTGNFISQDPPALAYYNPPHNNPGINTTDPMTLAPYAYSANDPINSSDPSGNTPKDSFGLGCLKLALCGAALLMPPDMTLPTPDHPTQIEAPSIPQEPAPDYDEARKAVGECLEELAKDGKEVPDPWKMTAEDMWIALRALGQLFREAAIEAVVEIGEALAFTIALVKSIINGP